MAAKKKKTKTSKKKKSRPKPKTAQTKPSKMAEVPINPDLKVTPHPTGKRVVDFEEKLDQQIQGGAPESEKRGRGRPLGSTKIPEDEAPGTVAIDRKVISDFVRIPFDMWGTSQRLNGLRLTDKEVAALADPVQTLMDYYLPEVPAIAFAWASLAITAYSLTSPRIRMIEQARKERKIKNEALRNANQVRPDQPRGPAPTQTSSASDKFPRPDQMTPIAIEN